MKPPDIEQHILSIACSVFDAYSAVLFLPDDEGRQHYLSAFFSLGDNIASDCAITPGKGLVGWIIDNRKPMIVDNFDKQESALGYYSRGAEEGIKAFMGYPVPTGGALCVDSKRQYSFSPKDYKLLQLFAELFAKQQSLGNADLAGDIPRYFAELGVIQNLRFRYKSWNSLLKNFLSTMSAATDFDYCAFATLQEGSDYYCIEGESRDILLADGEKPRMPLASGLTGFVFLNAQPVVVEGEHTVPSAALFGKVPGMPEFPAVICMPVMIEKACRGVLCLAHTAPRVIDESMRNFVRQAVDHLSLFLENLYLKNRLFHLMPRAKVDSSPIPHISDKNRSSRRAEDGISE